jgi:methylenetetrahydrofolate dehydrogenase (NADP+)/methenyltetrahydrofolate cyclohydrolase
MIVVGKQIADDIYRSLHTARSLSLGIVVCGSDPVTESFVRIKSKSAQRLGVSLVERRLSETATTEEVMEALSSLKECDGVIVQLPLPTRVNTDAVLELIPAHQDVDGVSPHARVRPPVAGAVAEIISRAGVSVENKKSVVVGHGRLVGSPCAQLLRDMGSHVTVVTKEKGTLESINDADVIVLGAGNPGFITPEMIKENVVLIDAGTSEQGGKVSGDADPSCAPKCSVFTPVPGGVGPIAVAMIFKNLYELSK